MGFEYALRFDHPGSGAVVEVVERHPACRRLAPGPLEFELRAERVTDAIRMPRRGLSRGGASFCSNGGSGNRPLGELIVRPVGTFGAVTVAELE